MVKTYRYRIYPNKSQETMFMKTFGCVRFIYNRMLFDRLKYYRETGKMLFNTPAQYKDTYPFLREVDSLALANAQLHLNNAYKNYFQRKGAGRPRFKSRKSLHQSYATNNQRGSVRIERGHIRLPKIGFIRIRQHRPFTGKIKTVTVTRTLGGRYYVSILVEDENQVRAIDPQTFAGIAFSLHGLYAASDGTGADMPQNCLRTLRRLRREQRKMARTERNSRNRVKQRRRVPTLSDRFTNQRADFLQKVTTQLARQYDAICIEEISARKLGREFGKGNRIGHMLTRKGWSLFVIMLQYKLAWQGKALIRVNIPHGRLLRSDDLEGAKRSFRLLPREKRSPFADAADCAAAVRIRDKGRSQIPATA